MVARGDLGLEMPLERVPRAQKEITRRARCRQAGDRRDAGARVDDDRARPTRAEVNDAANAVDDGVDAIMLAGETAVGAHAVRAVQTLDAIIRDAETRAAAQPSPSVDRRCRARRSRAGALRGRGHARRPRRRAGDRRRHARRDARRARCRRCGRARRSSRRPSATRSRGGSTLYWGVVPLVHADRRERRRGRHADRRSSSSTRGLVAAGGTVVFVSISPDLTPPRRQLPQDSATLMPDIRYTTIAAVVLAVRARGRGRRASRTPSSIACSTRSTSSAPRTARRCTRARGS